MKCEHCGGAVHENDRLMTLIVSATSQWLCYECALAWVSEPSASLDFEPSEMGEQWPRYYEQ